MNQPHPSHPEPGPGPSPGADRIELLMSRIVDGKAGAEEWGEFGSCADRDGRLWRELAESQRDFAALSRVVRAAGEVAERISITSLGEHGRRRADVHSLPRLAWLGWAAAAAIALAWGGKVMNNGPSPQGRNAANLVPSFADPDEAFAAYLDAGRRSGTVLGEVPQRVLVQSRPIVQMGIGGVPEQLVEVVFVRQVVERAVVPSIYQLGVSEDGSAVAVPMDTSSLNPTRRW